MKSKTTKRHIINRLTDKKPRLAAKLRKENLGSSFSEEDPDQVHTDCSNARVHFKMNTPSESNPIAIINPNDVIITELKHFFYLHVNPVKMARHPWRLGQDTFNVPRRLRHTLCHVWVNFYSVPEICSQVSTKDMLFQCCRALQKKLGRGPRDKTAVGIDRLELAAMTSNGMALFPRLEVSVKGINRATKQPFIAHARASWAFGYGPKHYIDSNIVVIVQTKEPSDFSSGRMELLTCLAIIHEHRRKAGKTNRDITGFYTDGKTYKFMCIRSDGVVLESDYYEILRDVDLKVVFNFITTLFENACTVHPTSLQ